jgi:hypothetical protein
MKINTITRALVLLTVATGALAVGCELIVDFDRTKIPVEAVADATVPDSSVPTEASTGNPADGAANDGGPTTDSASATSDASDAAPE